MRSGPYDDVLAQGRRGTIRVVLVGSAVVVAIVAAVAGLLAWASRAPAPATAEGPTTAPTTAAATSPTAPGVEVLETPGLDIVMPDDLVWRDVRGVSLPYSVSKGPSNALGGLASGFAHDGAGAVLAAAHIMVRINPQVGPDVFEPTLRNQVVGPGVDIVRTMINDVYASLRERAGVPYGDPVGQIYSSLRGFRVENYTDTDTDVRLIADGLDSSGKTTTGALLLHMRWSSDDWVLVVPPNGDFSSENIFLDETSVYTPIGAG